MSKYIIFAVLIGLLSSEAGADARSQWQEPFSVTLPERARSILLKPGADASSLADELGLTQFRILSRGRSGTMLETRLNDEEWQRVEQTACSGSFVEACETAGCQAIQLQGDATPGSDQGAQQVQARLVRNPPELVPVPDEADLEAGTCSGPPLIPPLAGPAGAGPGNLALDLRILRGLPGSSSSTAGQPGPGPTPTSPPRTQPGPGAGGAGDVVGEVGPQAGEVPGTAPGAEGQVALGDVEADGVRSDGVAPDGVEPDGPSVDPAAGADSAAGGQPAGAGETSPQTGTAAGSRTGERRSFAFALNSRFNPRGGVQLGTDELPEDTSDWSLVVGAGCSEVSVPLDSLAPARAPGLVLAVVTGNAADVASAYNLQVVREISLDTTGETLAVFATADNISQVIARLGMDGRVSGAQPEFVYVTTALPGDAAAAPAVGHSDPFAWLTYGPEKTGAVGLHGEKLKGAGQLVAVVDTGVDVEHPELKGRIREHMDLTDRGWSADAHGTAIAGIIAANADNGLGSYGVAPESQILALKACQPKEGGLQARCWTSTLVKALDVAMSKEASVINMSLAGPPDDLLARYVALATAQNRVVVAAAGNGGPSAKPGFPAALPGVVAVTAVDANDALYEKANLGEYIDVAAPGVDIVTPAPAGGGYPPLSGTSMAAAHASGIAALLRELMPMMSAAEIAAVLKSNASDLGDPGSDPSFGAGLVDACATAERVSAAAVVCPGDPAPAPAGPISQEMIDVDTQPDTGVSDELVIELD